jgi:cell division protein FtsI (penicillin-binding protein 3)
VILDSPTGLHQGGQVCAPVFKRIAQQVLEYLHVPHDLDVKNPQREQLMASAKDNDVDESSDRLGAAVQGEETATANPSPASPKPAVESSAAPAATAVPVETKPPTAETALAQAAPPSQPAPAGQAPTSGTVVLDVDSGVVVPSFLGKPLRSAVEIAQQSGLEINAVGSGVAREQWPAPGSRLPSGQHITVRFAH